MKIQILTAAREKIPNPPIHDFERLPIIFRQFGHDVDYVVKSEWSKFYWKYLKFKPDVIIAVGPIAALPGFLKKIGFIRKSLLVNDWTDYWTETMGEKHGIAKIAFLEFYGIEKADVIVTSTKFNYDRALLLGKKTYYRQHGVDLDLEKVKEAKLEGKFKILYCGSQDNKMKRIEKLIEAVKGLDCDLYLIGKPNPELQKTAGKNVHFLGFIPPNEIASYYKAADIITMTMDSDGSLKLFEAFKVGKPLLALNGRISNILTHRENAYLTPNLREGIIEIMKDKKLREYLSTNIRKIKTMTWEEVAKFYLEILDKELKLRKP